MLHAIISQILDVVKERDGEKYLRPPGEEADPGEIVRPRSRQLHHGIEFRLGVVDRVAQRADGSRARVVLAAPQSLRALLEASLPGVEIVEGLATELPPR